jgi:hypothetical protein
MVLVPGKTNIKEIGKLRYKLRGSALCRGLQQIHVPRLREVFFPVQVILGRRRKIAKPHASGVGSGWEEESGADAV